MSFKEINFRDVKENVISLLADGWALVSAGDGESFNTMTVSWGAVGELWGKDYATIYIRPQRYTLEFLDKKDYFTLSFFPEEYKSALAICGRKSGRDTDKISETGLTPDFSEKAPFFSEAKLALVCRKTAKQQFDPKCFIDKKIMDNYKQNDFHYMFFGEIEKVLILE